MINPSHRELLDNLISSRGIYFENIKEYQQIDVGTKIIYLERAIQQDCLTFLQSLDKLYQPNLPKNAENENLELIRAFKIINDLYQNNDVKFGDFGLRKALCHYFSSLGLVNPTDLQVPPPGTVNPIDFKEVIRETINMDIEILSTPNIEEIQNQKYARQLAEADISSQSEWRNKLDLPKKQLPIASYSQLEISLNGTITEEQYLSLENEIKQLITSHTAKIRELIEDYEMTFNNISSLSALELQTFLSDDLDLVDGIGMSIPSLFLLETDVRNKILSNLNTFDILVNAADISIDDLLIIDKPILNQLINNAEHIYILIKEIDISIAELMDLEETLRGKLIDNAPSLSLLVTEADIPLNELINLEPLKLSEIFENSSSVLRLLKEMNVPYKKLLSLPITELHVVLTEKDSEGAKEILQIMMEPPNKKLRM
jgi:hypothetical protein